jgi:RNA polymerase sigma-70 factor (ECF subfamily)
MPDELSTRVASLSATAARGDTSAFRELVAVTTPTVYRLALRIAGSEAEAEDVTQETFVRVWQKLATLRDHQAAFGWICRIARNVATDVVRTRKRRPTQSLSMPTGAGLEALGDVLEDATPSVEERLSNAEAARAVLALVDQLKEKHRVVLLLREVDGMTTVETAAALGIPEGTVESRLHRARRALAAKIERAVRRGSQEAA